METELSAKCYRTAYRKGECHEIFKQTKFQGLLFVKESQSIVSYLFVKTKKNLSLIR